jgi:hypothetical protein
MKKRGTQRMGAPENNPFCLPSERQIAAAGSEELNTRPDDSPGEIDGSTRSDTSVSFG